MILLLSLFISLNVGLEYLSKSRRKSFSDLIGASFIGSLLLPDMMMVTVRCLLSILFIALFTDSLNFYRVGSDCEFVVSDDFDYKLCQVRLLYPFGFFRLHLFFQL